MSHSRETSRAVVRGHVMNQTASMASRTKRMTRPKRTAGAGRTGRRRRGRGRREARRCADMAETLLAHRPGPLPAPCLPSHYSLATRMKRHLFSTAIVGGSNLFSRSMMVCGREARQWRMGGRGRDCEASADSACRGAAPEPAQPPNLPTSAQHASPYLLNVLLQEQRSLFQRRRRLPNELGRLRERRQRERTRAGRSKSGASWAALPTNKRTQFNSGQPRAAQGSPVQEQQQAHVGQEAGDLVGRWDAGLPQRSRHGGLVAERRRGLGERGGLRLQRLQCGDGRHDAGPARTHAGRRRERARPAWAWRNGGAGMLGSSPGDGSSGRERAAVRPVSGWLNSVEQLARRPIALT